MKRIITIAKISWEFSATYYLLIFLLSVVSGVQMLLALYLPAKFVEAIISGTIGKKTIGLMILIMIVNLVFHFFCKFLENRLEIEKVYVNDMVNLKLSDKIMDFSYEKIESPYYLDLRQRALYSIETQDALTNLLITSSSLIKKTVLAVELLVVVYMFSKVMVAVILAVVLMISFFYFLFKKYETDYNKKMVGYKRKFSYYLGLCFDETIQKDIRLYQMEEMLTRKVRDSNVELLRRQKNYYNIRGIYNGTVSFLSILQTALAYIFVIHRTYVEAKSKLLSYGEFTFYINAIINLFSLLKEIVWEIVNITQMLSYLDPFLEFMLIEDNSLLYGDLICTDDIESLEFKNVSFCYPGATSMALKDVSFTIKGKEKVSLVGLNGAGKTTIVKLICRFYKPTSGQILVNGVDIWKYNRAALNDRISAVFQDYKMFAISIKENITCSSQKDISATGDWFNVLGLNNLVSKYKKGLYTVLNKAYNDEGIDISGGEKQKLAIARALNKDGDIFILDEPTASLDPIAEAEVFAQFEKVTKDKMTIYVSHRMSSSKLCDRIIVLKDGEVDDIGTHAELMESRQGLYYQMFTAQSNYYNNARKNARGQV